MSKPSLLLVDNLDDRREIWHLLHRLAPWKRIAFLQKSCNRITGPMRPTPSLHRMRSVIQTAYRCEQANEQLTNEVYGDIMVMGSQYKLDLVEIARDLEQVVKRPGGLGPVRTPCSNGSGLWVAGHPS